jgi:hypothetical protein
MELRNEVYAHTDDTEFRRVVNAAPIFGGTIEIPALVTAPLNNDRVALVAPMTKRQATRFKRERHALIRRLGGAAD